MAQLSNYCYVEGGFAYKSGDFKDEGIHKVIKIKNIRTGNVDYSNTSFIDDNLGKKTLKWATQHGDVLISMTGSGPNAPASVVGRVARVSKNDPTAFINQRIGRLRLKYDKAISLDFVYYLLSMPHSQNFLVSNSSGSANQANISGKTIEAIACPAISYNDSVSIASILVALDDKIENNRRMNETLEEMARTIFKSWFVDFDPVHAKAAGNAPALMDAETAALFSNAFGDDGLPLGWEKKTLGDLILPKRGKTITKSKTTEGTIPVVAGGLEPAYFHNQSNVEAPVITISASGANAGFTRLYNENIWASDCSYISKQLTDTIYFWYVFLKINQWKIYHMQQGAAQPHIYPSDLMRLELTTPSDKKLIQHFEHLISPCFQRISTAQKESKTLAELRDTLLPKLMSGEIRVKDAEREVEVAV